MRIGAEILHNIWLVVAQRRRSKQAFHCHCNRPYATMDEIRTMQGSTSLPVHKFGGIFQLFKAACLATELICAGMTGNLGLRRETLSSVYVRWCSNEWNYESRAEALNQVDRESVAGKEA